MKSYQIIAVIVAVLALLWIGSGLLRSGEPVADQKDVPPQTERTLQQVRVREIKPQDYIDDVVVTGRSQASKRVEIKAETTGAITDLLKEEGESVEEKAVLAHLELRDRESRVQEAKGRVNQRQIEYNAARRLAGEGFNSKVRLAQSRADLDNAKAILKDAQASLTKTTIIAPFAGIIAEQFVEVGDYLAPGERLFTLVNLNPIEFTGFVSERQIDKITLGKDTLVQFLDGSAAQGTVSYVAPAANEQTRTFRVIVSMNNEALVIKEGLTATLRIPAKKKQAYKISPSILSLDDHGAVGVKIVDADHIVKFLPVNVLADKIDAMWVEVKGHSDALHFITVGQEFVGTEQKVEPVAAEGDGLL